VAHFSFYRKIVTLSLVTYAFANSVYMLAIYFDKAHQIFEIHLHLFLILHLMIPITYWRFCPVPPVSQACTSTVHKLSSMPTPCYTRIIPTITHLTRMQIGEIKIAQQLGAFRQ
jgi:hypothetical protein